MDKNNILQRNTMKFLKILIKNKEKKISTHTYRHNINNSLSIIYKNSNIIKEYLKLFKKYIRLA